MNQNQIKLGVCNQSWRKGLALAGLAGFVVVAGLASVPAAHANLYPLVAAELGETPTDNEGWDAISEAEDQAAPAVTAAAPALSLTAQFANPEAICTRTPADIQKLAYDADMRISVYNHGGLFDGGVCWWHSRLQRSALYLAVFRPDLPKATRGQALAIINNLARFAGINVIPGYANFHEFTRDYENEIIARLESWQKKDGFLKFRWVDGLKGDWHLSSGSVLGIVQAIDKMVNVQHRILFEKLHFSHVATHAYLIIGSRQTADGYDIDVIDSNDPGATNVVHYKRGDTSLYTSMGHEPVIPYLDYEGDMGYIRGAIAGYCRANGHPGVVLP